jgi:hypothetical protein
MRVVRRETRRKTFNALGFVNIELGHKFAASLCGDERLVWFAASMA